MPTMAPLTPPAEYATADLGAARRSGLSEPAIRYRIVKGEVPAIWNGGRLRIPADAVEHLRGAGDGMRRYLPSLVPSA